MTIQNTSFFAQNTVFIKFNSYVNINVNVNYFTYVLTPAHVFMFYSWLANGYFWSFFPNYTFFSSLFFFFKPWLVFLNFMFIFLPDFH